MEPVKQSHSQISLTDSTFDQAINSWYKDSPDTLSEDQNKQSLINLAPELRFPSTPARKTSEFFDKINNLDPVKFSPPDPSPRPRMSPVLEK